MTRRSASCVDCDTEVSIEGRGAIPKRCPTCKAEEKRRLNRAHYSANTMAIQKQQREYKFVRRAGLATWQRDYYAQNRDAILLQKQNYYERNRDVVRENAARNRRENAARYCEYVRARQARQRAAFVVPVDHQMIYERDSGICGLCEQPVDPTLRWPDLLSATIDHIIPLARGGVHGPDNVQLAHMRCNSSKGARVA